MSNNEEQERLIQDIVTVIETLLRSGNKSSQIVTNLTSQGMDHETAKKLVRHVKRNMILSHVPDPLIIGVREAVMFVGFGLAGLLVSIIASFILSIIGTVFSQIPGIGGTVKGLMKLGEKIIGGLLGIGFAAFAQNMGTIAGAFGALVGSGIAVYLIAHRH